MNPLFEVVIMWFELVSPLFEVPSTLLMRTDWQVLILGERRRGEARKFMDWQLLSVRRFLERFLRGFLLLRAIWWWEGVAGSSSPPSHLSTLITQPFTTEGRPELNLGGWARDKEANKFYTSLKLISGG